MTTTHLYGDWDIFVSALAATTAQIPDNTTSITWGTQNGPRFDATRTADGQFAIIVDVTDFPDAISPDLPSELGWYTPSYAPPQGPLFKLARNSAQDLTEDTFRMLTEWAQISEPSVFLTTGEADADDGPPQLKWFKGRELSTGLELREEFEYLFSQLDIPCSGRGMPGGYTVYVADVQVDLLIREFAPSIQLQAMVRQDIPDLVDGIALANQANSVAVFARFHYEGARNRVLATWHLNQSFYTPRALFQGIVDFANDVHEIAGGIHPSVPRTPAHWDAPSTNYSLPLD